MTGSRVILVAVLAAAGALSPAVESSVAFTVKTAAP
jgi:hypothetical protein